jgi:hypothetical protein
LGASGSLLTLALSKKIVREDFERIHFVFCSNFLKNTKGSRSKTAQVIEFLNMKKSVRLRQEQEKSLSD